MDNSVETDLHCDNCTAALRLVAGEDADHTSECAECGHEYHDCGGCGETVSESGWDAAVTMCKECLHRACDRD